MELYYYVSERGNFGDDLNVWLWDAIMPDWRSWNSDKTLFGVGTILNDALLRQYDSPLILGSGVGYGPAPGEGTISKSDVRCVRGPRSAEAVNLSPDFPMLDPAMMIPDLIENVVDTNRERSDIVFVPHYSTSALKLKWRELCQSISIEYVSPEGQAMDVISKIANARLVIAESMHAAIIADAYRVPWVPIEMNDNFNRYKWHDWSENLDLEIDFFDVFSEVNRVKQIVSNWSRRTNDPSTGTGAAIGGAANPASTKSQQSHSDNRKKIIRAIEFFSPLIELVVRKKLLKASKLRPYMSRDSILLSKKKIFQQVINEVMNDYGK